MDLAVQKRTQFGRGVKALRGEGLVPAEFYGHGMENQHFAVSRKDLEKVFSQAGEHTVISLITGDEKKQAIIYNVQRDYLSGEIIHADFYGVRMDEKITTSVPIEFVGEAPGVKEHGGVLNKTISEVEVEALPGDLPHSFVVDLGILTGLDQSIYVKDLKASEKVKMLLDPDTVIVTLTPPAAEEEAPPAEQVDLSAVKVEGEEKRAEREAQKAAEGTGPGEKEPK